MKRLLILCFLLVIAIPAQADRDKNDSGYQRGLVQVTTQKKHKHNKKKGLPPGWREKIVKGKPLADDVFYQLKPVPPKVFVTLPPPPPGIAYKQIEGEIIKIDTANRRILDVLTRNAISLPLPPLPGLK